MKILVIGLEGISPEFILADDRLTNFQRLMEFGCYGQLAVFPPSEAVPPAMYMATSRPPDSFRPGAETPIWEYLTTFGKRSLVIGLPRVGADDILIFPASLRKEGVVEDYPVRPELTAVSGQSEWQDAIYAMSRRQFAVARQLIETADWDYFHFAITGLEEIQRHFRQASDTDHIHEHVIPSYYRYLDDELGGVFALLDEDTAVLLVSTGGAQPAAGRSDVSAGFFILAAINNPLHGEVTGAGLLDVMPTLLELSGVPIPEFMMGTSLFQINTLTEAEAADLSAEEEDILRERLSGLGYIS